MSASNRHCKRNTKDLNCTFMMRIFMCRYLKIMEYTIYIYIYYKKKNFLKMAWGYQIILQMQLNHFSVRYMRLYFSIYKENAKYSYILYVYYRKLLVYSKLLGTKRHSHFSVMNYISMSRIYIENFFISMYIAVHVATYSIYVLKDVRSSNTKCFSRKQILLWK